MSVLPATQRIGGPPRIGTGTATLATVALLSWTACDGASTHSFAEPAHFAEGDSAYVVSAVSARVGALDDEGHVFGSIVDVDKTAFGWAVLDGMNDHIVLLDPELGPLRTVGRAGEGPGEYESLWQLSLVGDTMAVFDRGAGRVTYLGPEGGFLRSSEPIRHVAMTFAIHPTLGRFFPIRAPHHYLLRATEGDQLPVAPIPYDFRPDINEPDGGGGFTSNLVAVTPDGTVHVFDGRHLALVTYPPNEATSRITFLPNEVRDPLLKEMTEAENASWGQGLLFMFLVTKIDLLERGRLFVQVRHGGTVGYVLDTESLRATPVLVGDDWDWLQDRNAAFFDGKHLVLDGGLTPELVLATTELVPRSLADGGEE